MKVKARDVLKKAQDVSDEDLSEYGSDEDLSEYEEFSKFEDVHELIDSNGIAAVRAFAELYGEVQDGWEFAQKFPDAFAGVWESELKYAEDFIADVYNLEEMMGNLAFYFDYEAFTRDLFINDMTSMDLPDGEVAVFHNSW